MQVKEIIKNRKIVNIVCLIAVMVILSSVGNVNASQDNAAREDIQKVEVYEKKIKKYFQRQIASNILEDLSVYLDWKEIPTKAGDKWLFNIKNEKHDWYDFHVKYINVLKSFETQILNEEAGIDQELTYFIKITIPVHIFVGDNKYTQRFEVALSRNSDKNRNTWLHHETLDPKVTWDYKQFECIFMTYENGSFVDVNRARNIKELYAIAIKQSDLKKGVRIRLGSMDEVRIDYQFFI